jgi:tRNA-Thr(GGU) m(6)t(6)A37 methyltransferase TsaA
MKPTSIILSIIHHNLCDNNMAGRNNDTILQYIGVVESAGETSEIQIFPEYCAGLQAISDYENIMILFWMHMQDNDAGRKRLISSRLRRGEEGFRGVFATHSPHRPNPIGVTVVELVSVEECKLIVKGLDAFVETPILDIKSVPVSANPLFYLDK